MSYSQKGFKADGLIFESNFDPKTGDTASITTLIYKVHTIEFPINFLYELSLKKMGKLFFVTGLYFGANIGGMQKLKSDNFEEERELKFGEKQTDDDYVADIGLNVGIGYQFPFRIYTRLQYSLGVPDFLNSNAMKKNRILSIGVGYNF